IIGARIASARAAANAAATAAQPGAAIPAATGGYGGPSTMTPAQQQREINRRAREMAAAQRAAERERAAAERRARADARARDRMVETGVRTAGRVLSSRAGQDIIRGVFGTLFGGKR